eukprot:1108772-Prymnesium_polylepis.2
MANGRWYLEWMFKFHIVDMMYTTAAFLVPSNANARQSLHTQQRVDNVNVLCGMTVIVCLVALYRRWNGTRSASM